jgi:hypothetical protein
MMTPWRSAVVLLAVLSVTLGAERSTHKFNAHAFSLELPSGYTLQGEGSPRTGFAVFGFATEPRLDGTRGLIQVSLLDLSQAPAGEKVSLEKFATAMIDGVRKRRSQWNQTESALEIGGVSGKRIQWDGASEPGFGRPPVAMRGIMIIGIKKDVGFSLHTQDLVPAADSTLPLGEQALKTFALTLRP